MLAKTKNNQIVTFDYNLMKDFNIALNNNKGHTLSAKVQFKYPDHFIVDIKHLKLTLKVIRNEDGDLECENTNKVNSTLVNDICCQINKKLILSNY